MSLLHSRSGGLGSFHLDTLISPTLISPTKEGRWRRRVQMEKEWSKGRRKEGEEGERNQESKKVTTRSSSKSHLLPTSTIRITSS